MTLYPSPSPSSSIPVTLDCRHIVVNVNRALPGKPRSSWYITSWNGPQPMAMLPPIEVEEEEVIRAKRLINSHAFRRLFPSPFVHPFRNLFATSIPLRDIAVCKYHVLHPFFSPFDPVSFNPSFLSPRQPREWISPRIRFPRSNRNWVANLAPRKRERVRKKEIIIAFHGKICKFVSIRGLVTIVIFHRVYLDRF